MEFKFTFITDENVPPLIYMENVPWLCYLSSGGGGKESNLLWGENFEEELTVKNFLY